MDHFRKLGNVSVFAEPVDKWRDLNGHNLLQLMYENPDRHSLTFQSYVQLTMAQIHAEKTPPGKVKMMERSLWSARYVFSENLKRSGKMASSEFEVLDSWFDFLRTSDQVDLGADLVIYLRTSPEVSYERLKARARPEEKVVSIDYLRDVHELHEKWLILNKDSSRYGGAKLLVIDANKDMTEVPHVYSEHECLIFEAIESFHDKLKRPRRCERVSSALVDVTNNS